MARIKSKKPRAKFNMYFICHLRACFSSLGRIIMSPFANLMTVLVLAIALALPLTLYVMLSNVRNLGASFNKSSAQISLYLRSGLSRVQTEDLLHQLRSDPYISAVKYVSPSRGLRQFAATLGGTQITKLLKKNPLPGVVVVQPILSLHNPAQLQQLANRLQEFSVVTMSQLDMRWLQRLNGIVDLADDIVFALAILLVFGVLLIIGNTIRLATQSERKEIAIFKLVGATNAFIRRPFLYTGIWYGFFSGALALALVTVIMSCLQAPVNNLASTYNEVFILRGLSLNLWAVFIVGSMFLGFIGSWLAVNRSLCSYL